MMPLGNVQPCNRITHETHAKVYAIGQVNRMMIIAHKVYGLDYI